MTKGIGADRDRYRSALSLAKPLVKSEAKVKGSTERLNFVVPVDGTVSDLKELAAERYGLPSKAFVKVELQK